MRAVRARGGGRAWCGGPLAPTVPYSPPGQLRSAQQRPLGCGQLRTIITAREQVTVAVRRHLNRGMPEATAAVGGLASGCVVALAAALASTSSPLARRGPGALNGRPGPPLSIQRAGA